MSYSHSHNDHTHDHGDQHHTHNDRCHDYSHQHDASSWFGKLQHAIPFLHGHSHGEKPVDTAMETNARGIWALKVSLLLLTITALFQVIIVFISGSVALFADTIHNFSDALTAVPLWIAFTLARRPATRRYTYGFGRAEDIAGVCIVLMIVASAIIVAYESIMKIFHPQPLNYVGWVISASLIGFIGNEVVAQLRIHVGREIGSAALVADGQHARVDGFTSLAVLFGAIGSLLNIPLADPIIGLLITLAILFLVKDTIVVMWHRLMDAVDPQLIDTLEKITRQVAGVEQVKTMKGRWIGHRFHVEVQVVVNEDLSARESYQVVEAIRHALRHAQPHIEAIVVQLLPCGHHTSTIDHTLQVVPS